METALLVFVGGALALIVGALYQWVVGPAEHEKGVSDAQALARAHAEGVKAAEAAVDKVTEASLKKDDQRAADAKAEDPVDFANRIIQKGRKS